MYLPHVDDERTTLCRYLEVQLDALRAATLGLDDAQARQRPLRSQLSIAGIIKHIGFCMAGSLVGAGRRASDQVDQDFLGSFVPTQDEDLATLLARFDALRDDYLAMCRDGDLDAVLPVGPMPWDGLDEARPVCLRYLYGLFTIQGVDPV